MKARGHPGPSSRFDRSTGSLYDRRMKAPEPQALSFWDVVPSSIGDLLVAVAADGAVLQLAFQPPGPEQSFHEGARDPGRCAHVTRQLDEYLAGTRRLFDLEVAPSGTPFQRRVWTEVATIPYGTTVSYGELAARLGDPGAARAVGAANGRNPIPIVIPCHRVVGADGSLVGYGGGLELKQTLLEFEGALPPAAAQRRLAFGAASKGDSSTVPPHERPPRPPV